MKTLALPGLIERLVSATEVQASVAEKFISEFISIITSELADGHSVSVKGVGTFRVINNGVEETVEFAPEASLAEGVNAPFSMFEPLELPEGVTAEMLDHQMDGNNGAMPEESVAPAAEKKAVVEETIEETFEESVEETVEDTVQESVEETVEEAVAAAATSSSPTPPPIPSYLKSGAEPEQPESQPDTVPQPAAEDEPEPADEPKPEPIPEPEPESASEPQPEVVVVKKIVHVPAETAHDATETNSHHRHSTATLVLAIIVALLAGLMIGYFALTHINFGHVRSVNIEAADVQVNQLPSHAESEDSLESEATEPTDTTSKATEVGEAAVQNEGTASAAPDKPTVVLDTVKGARYLTTIALRHYGKKKFWVYIYEENRDKISDPDHVPANTVVVVPPAEKYSIKAGDPASENDANRRAEDIYRRIGK